MKDIIINGIPGRVYQGQWPDTLCFVPNVALEDGRLLREVYVGQKFSELNFLANNNVSIGNSLFPDLEQPVTEPDSRLTAFILRLEGGSGMPTQHLPTCKDQDLDDFARESLRKRKGRDRR